MGSSVFARLEEPTRLWTGFGFRQAKQGFAHYAKPGSAHVDPKRLGLLSS